MANEDKSARYHRLRRRAILLGTTWQAVFLILLMVTGVSAQIRDAITAAVGPGLVPLVTGYVLLLSVIYGIVQVPLAFYRGVVLEQRYGLSTETTARWWADHIKAAALFVVYLVGVGLVLTSLLRVSPARWWIGAAVSVAIVLALLARLAPVILLPRLYDVKPIDREGLRARLFALATRAGAPVLDVVEWRVGDRTKKANAALVGLGRARRILVSDTLLAAHSDDEIEAVIAHEIAHHVYGDIWSSIALETAIATVGFYLADRVLTLSVTALGLGGKADVAALPLVALTVGAVSFALMPVVNALSRAQERRADRYALDTTKNSAAFISAMKRLAARNLAEEHPSRWVELLFHTHPTTADRIEAAKTYFDRTTSSPFI